MQMSGFSSLEMSGSRHRVGPGGRVGRHEMPDDEHQGAEPARDSGPCAGAATDASPSGRSAGSERSPSRAAVQEVSARGCVRLGFEEAGPCEQPQAAGESSRACSGTLVESRCSDFGPTLAAEKLREIPGVVVSVETLRRWMIAAELWVPRSQRARRVHQPRHRRSCVGELVQIDGCEHAWFEDRAPKCTLLDYVDDATRRLMELRFVASESTFDYFAATQTYLERHGKPVAFYSDKASIFRVHGAEARRSGGVTQFGRALSELNIEILCANTPQAKGRVERAHLTLQDRLVKELRLRGAWPARRSPGAKRSGSEPLRREPTRRSRRPEAASGEHPRAGTAPPHPQGRQASPPDRVLGPNAADGRRPDISSLPRTRHFYFGLTRKTLLWRSIGRTARRTSPLASASSIRTSAPASPLTRGAPPASGRGRAPARPGWPPLRSRRRPSARVPM